MISPTEQPQVEDGTIVTATINSGRYGEEDQPIPPVCVRLFAPHLVASEMIRSNQAPGQQDTAELRIYTGVSAFEITAMVGSYYRLLEWLAEQGAPEDVIEKARARGSYAPPRRYRVCKRRTSQTDIAYDCQVDHGGYWETNNTLDSLEDARIEVLHYFGSAYAHAHERGLFLKVDVDLSGDAVDDDLE